MSSFPEIVFKMKFNSQYLFLLNKTCKTVKKQPQKQKNALDVLELIQNS